LNTGRVHALSKSADHVWRLIVRYGVGGPDFHHASLDGAQQSADHPVLTVVAPDERIADAEEHNRLDLHSNAGRSGWQIKRSHPHYISLLKGVLRAMSSGCSKLFKFALVRRRLFMRGT